MCLEGSKLYFKQNRPLFLRQICGSLCWVSLVQNKVPGAHQLEAHTDFCIDCMLGTQVRPKQGKKGVPEINKNQFGPSIFSHQKKKKKKKREWDVNLSQEHLAKCLYTLCYKLFVFFRVNGEGGHTFFTNCCQRSANNMLTVKARHVWGHWRWQHNMFEDTDSDGTTCLRTLTVHVWGHWQ